MTDSVLLMTLAAVSAAPLSHQMQNMAPAGAAILLPWKALTLNCLALSAEHCQEVLPRTQ